MPTQTTVTRYYKRKGGAKRRRVSATVPRRRFRYNMNLRRDIYSFKRSISNPGTFQGNAVSPLLIGQSNTFAQIANSAEFTTLFDQYQITYIQMKFFLRIDPSAQPAATAAYPKLHIVRDYDDASTPANINELREHPRVMQRVLTPTRAVTFGWKPAVATNLFLTPITNGTEPRWKVWVDMANTGLPHYGIKFAIDNFTNTSYFVDTEMKYWFKVRGVR